MSGRLQAQGDVRGLLRGFDGADVDGHRQPPHLTVRVEGAQRLHSRQRKRSGCRRRSTGGEGVGARRGVVAETGLHERQLQPTLVIVGRDLQRCAEALARSAPLATGEIASRSALQPVGAWVHGVAEARSMGSLRYPAVQSLRDRRLTPAPLRIYRFGPYTF